jgi:hypothetical protein
MTGDEWSDDVWRYHILWLGTPHLHFDNEGYLGWHLQWMLKLVSKIDERLPAIFGRRKDP